MSNVTFHPLLIFVLSFAALWLTAWVGAWLRKKAREQEAEFRDDFGVILAATLTLLALIIGFSFSMATTRYDQRKNYEEQEANAIGTEYLRADLLSPVDAAKMRSLLRRYLDQRILFYTVHDEEELRPISARTVRLQTELWAAVKPAAAEQPTPVVALVSAGVNDVLNAQGYTQAAFWNRIPTRGVGADDGNRHLLQLAVWLWFTIQGQGQTASGPPDYNFHCVHARLGHRHPSPWHRSRKSSKSSQPCGISACTIGGVAPCG